MRIPFAAGFLSIEPGAYSLRMGDATDGAPVHGWDGPTSIPWDLLETIIPGNGGDDSNWSEGTLFEGALTFGRPSAADDEAVYANIQAAGFGQ